ncbi:MAG: hypothetical protein F4X23_03495 [Gemmatimonadales bacterium]|nr:hypothetical protein [Gemmatimonadales bacterium]
MRRVRPVKEWRRGQFLYGYDTATVVVPKSLPNASPGHLEAYGYAEAINDTLTTFYAPDGDALASPGFLATHCLDTTAPDDGVDDTVVGLAFEPRPGRAIVDVKGVLWIDTVTADLRRLEFEYTSLRPFLRMYLEPDLRMHVLSRTPNHLRRFVSFRQITVREELFGGWLGFERIAQGRWLIRKWEVHSPTLLHRGDTAGGRKSVEPVAFPLRHGGEVLEIVPP